MNALGNLILSLLNENKNYFIEVDYLTSFLLKLTGRNELAKNWFFKNCEAIRWVLTWINDNPKPPLASGPGTVLFYL